MWGYIAVFAIGLIASYYLTPKPQVNPPPSLADIEVPTAEVGREIPVLFGTRKIAGANVVWYGDIRTVPIKKKGGKK